MDVGINNDNQKFSMPQAFIMKQVNRITHKQRNITSNAVFNIFFGSERKSGGHVNYLDKHVLSYSPPPTGQAGAHAGEH